ncbi:MAG: hypothetical protein WC959_00985 [Kiritimatiellales bacterium]
MDGPIDIGSQLELFVDDYLIENIQGKIGLHLHRPVPQEVVFVTDMPWEGNVCSYYTLFQDENIYRMYYRGTNHRTPPEDEVICYAYSTNGIDWIRPNLGLIDFKGSKENNIIHNGVARHNFTPFKDTNPDCPPDEKYKAMGGHSRTGGLYAFKSADGVNWMLMQDEPVFPSSWEKRSGWPQPWFDSQNLAFWDPVRKAYVLYFRHFRDGTYRDVMLTTSPDLIHWSKDPEFLEYPGVSPEHLYTSSIIQYPRNPHFYIGFPTRFLSLTAQTEPLFMSSRDGLTFKRWPEAVIPVDAPADRDGNRSNYIWWGLLELPGNDAEYSIYAHEAYYEGAASRLRRFTYRKDGFVSLRAAPEGGVVETKLLRFSGTQMVLNYKTKAKHFRYDGGSVQVEIVDEGGYPVEGFSLSDCEKLQGDSIEQAVVWKSGRTLGMLDGVPVRFRFHMKYADLFSFRFL